MIAASKPLPENIFWPSAAGEKRRSGAGRTSSAVQCAARLFSSRRVAADELPAHVRTQPSDAARPVLCLLVLRGFPAAEPAARRCAASMCPSPPRAGRSPVVLCRADALL
jgi:hypothetical protein